MLLAPPEATRLRRSHGDWPDYAPPMRNRACLGLLLILLSGCGRGEIAHRQPTPVKTYFCGSYTPLPTGPAVSDPPCPQG
jgi:hypothetical protein